MERKKVNSSNIRAIGYDSGGRLLEVEFSNGSVMQFSNVSSELHRRLMNAPSIGSFFKDNIEEEFTGRRVK
jgi:hypothetical protein